MALLWLFSCLSNSTHYYHYYYSLLSSWDFEALIIIHVIGFIISFMKELLLFLIPYIRPYISGFFFSLDIFLS